MATDTIEPVDSTFSKQIGDTVVGGFTIIGDKTRYPLSASRVILPHWITQATVFPSDVNSRQNVHDIEELHDSMRTRLIEIGYTDLFPVQAYAIPVILRSYRIGKHRPLCRPCDICISAPTGSGKTLAYGVPIIQLLYRRTAIRLRALIILPVRDLATQVYNVLKELAKETDLKIAIVCGLKSFAKEQADLVDSSTGVAHPNADIVIATPGRLVDHLFNTPGFNPKYLRILVIDEADRVITEEKQDWYRLLEDVLYHAAVFSMDLDIQPNAKSTAKPTRSRPICSIIHQYDCSHDVTLQKILVSATLTHDPGPLKRFNLYFPHLLTSDTKSAQANKIQADAGDLPKEHMENINQAQDETMHVDDQSTGGVGVFSTPHGLQEFVVSVDMAQRALFLLHLIRHKRLSRILCFTNTRATTNRLSLLLQQFKSVKADELSTQMPPEKRSRILTSFSRGEINLLVCTDSMARGIDINNVECVISYEMPPTVKTYVHRIGRTARAGLPGVAYTLLSRNQFSHFKRDLRGVGKHKLKEVTFHASRMRDIHAEYEKALRKMESIVKKSTSSSKNKRLNFSEFVNSSAHKSPS